MFNAFNPTTHMFTDSFIRYAHFRCNFINTDFGCPRYADKSQLQCLWQSMATQNANQQHSSAVLWIFPPVCTLSSCSFLLNSHFTVHWTNLHILWPQTSDHRPLLFFDAFYRCRNIDKYYIIITTSLQDLHTATHIHIPHSGSPPIQHFYFFIITKTTDIKNKNKTFK
jgi:hypothetical protein